MDGPNLGLRKSTLWVWRNQRDFVAYLAAPAVSVKRKTTDTAD
jgi:hypothetical protein